LILAETCREAARLDQVWLMPAAEPPHNRERQLAPAKDRLEMLRLAVAGDASLMVSTLEIERGGVSYTVETLRAIHAAHPGDELFLLMGGDTLHDLPQWRSPAEILSLATPLVVTRQGSPQPDFQGVAPLVPPARLIQFREAIVAMPIIALSGSELRARVQAGQSIRYRTPRGVEKYIETHALYSVPKIANP
jgi:nicotinate-nucleotide adenylyltransferase